MNKWPALNQLIDQIYVDNMDNEFINLTGCWPKVYFFANNEGVTKWMSTVKMNKENIDLLTVGTYHTKTWLRRTNFSHLHQNQWQPWQKIKKNLKHQSYSEKVY